MSASPASPGYRSLLRLPGVPAFFAAALIGRLSYGTGSLALLLQIHRVTGSWGSAGSALAAFGVTNALLAPLRGWWIDRYGLRRILPVLATGYSAVLLAIGYADFSAASLIAMSAVAGILPPPLGPTTRRVWSHVATEPALLRKAYSLDTVAEETLFTLGPIVTGLVAGLADPAAALLATVVLVMTGTLGIVRSPLSGLPASIAAARADRPLRRPAFRRLLLVLFGTGLGLGGIEIAVASTAQHQGGASATGALLAAMSLGSVLGGLVYGHRSWRRPAALQLAVAVAMLAECLAVLAAPRTLVSLAVGLFVTGLFIAPSLIIGFTRSDELTDGATRTEAGTWVNSCLNLGGSAGTACAGVMVEHNGGGPTLLAAAAALAVTALVAAAAATNHVTPSGTMRA